MRAKSTFCDRSLLTEREKRRPNGGICRQNAGRTVSSWDEVASLVFLWLSVRGSRVGGPAERVRLTPPNSEPREIPGLFACPDVRSGRPIRS